MFNLLNLCWCNIEVGILIFVARGRVKLLGPNHLERLLSPRDEKFFDFEPEDDDDKARFPCQQFKDAK